MKFFWISWIQPTEDYRPLSYPPLPPILGWWCTGTIGMESIICAMVKAQSKDEAEQIIKLDWPEAKDWRFCDERVAGTLSDRFPLSDWMVERFETVNR